MELTPAEKLLEATKILVTNQKKEKSIIEKHKEFIEQRIKEKKAEEPYTIYDSWYVQGLRHALENIEELEAGK